MDWTLAMEEEQAVLKRIVALLFALADLAELACGRSPAVRGLLLWLLRPAEAAARNLVTGAPAQTPQRQASSSPADAMRLARDLRELAVALRASSRLTTGCANADGLPGERAPISVIPAHICASGMTLADAMSKALRACTRMPHDTS